MSRGRFRVVVVSSPDGAGVLARVVGGAVVVAVAVVVVVVAVVVGGVELGEVVSVLELLDCSGAGTPISVVDTDTLVVNDVVESDGVMMVGG